MKFTLTLVLLTLTLSHATEAPAVRYTVSDFQAIERQIASFCEAVQWRIQYEQQRVRELVEAQGQNSYDIWPAENDSLPAFDPDALTAELSRQMDGKQPPELAAFSAKLDSAERQLRSLDELGFLHFIWEPYSPLQLLFPETCYLLPPYPDPCHAAAVWAQMTTHGWWPSFIDPSLHIFILIPTINGIWTQTYIPLYMQSNKILIGLFRPKLISDGSTRAVVWSGIGFGVLAGFDISENNEEEGGGIQLNSVTQSSPVGLNVLIYNRIHHNHARSEGGGVFANIGTINVLIANQIESNTSEDEGGGFYADEGTINVLIGNRIEENHADVRGGGASFHPLSTVYMNGNRFEGNSAPIGGGAYLPTSFPIIARDNRYNENFAEIGEGGGVYDDGSYHVDYSHEKFTRNYSPVVSGGYHRTLAAPGSESYTLRAFRFRGNHAPKGGAIYILPGFDGVQLHGCAFDGNYADTSGGAVWIPPDQAEIEIAGCHFLANHALVGSAVYFVKDPGISTIVNVLRSRFGANYVTSAHGGACYFVTTGGDMTVRIDTSVFDGVNQTPFYGGALHVAGPATRLLISASEFSANQADRGGAIWAPAISEFRVVSSRFMGNFASHGGGAIWYPDGDYADFSIDSSHFEGNKTFERGGALWVNEQANVLVRHTTFQSNLADSGGAIAITDTGSAIRLLEDSLFSNVADEVGGAVYVAMQANLDTISGCVFSGNAVDPNSLVNTITTGLGGAIYLHSTLYDEDIVNCTFVSNDALWGGAIALDTFRVPFRIVGSSFISNGADRGNAGIGCGGAIFINGSNLDIVIGTPAVLDSNYFERNTAESGGAIAVFSGSSPIFQNNNFQQNKADRNGDGTGMGGAILAHDDRSDLIIGGNAVQNEDNTFAYNVAGTAGASREGRGGAIGVRYGASPFIRGNHFYYNGATYAGAGIADSTHVIDSTVIGGVNDDEIILSMNDPVPFQALQYGNRIFNTCDDIEIDSADLPTIVLPEDSVRICCCYNGSGAIIEMPFPANWLPDSSFHFPVDPELEVVECSPIDDPEIEMNQQTFDLLQSAAVPDSVRWPADRDSFCFVWPINMPIWPDSDWVPDTTSWRQEAPATSSWGRDEYYGLMSNRPDRNPLDDVYFPDGLGMLDPCDITGNYVPLFGGGISVEGVARPTISGNLIDHNCADSIGGGVWVDETITGARIGLADSLADSLSTDHKNFVQRNAAPYGGGLGFAGGSWAPIVNDIIGGRTDSLGNMACERGGGFYITESAYPSIGDTAKERNNLVRHNKAFFDIGGGLAVVGNAAPVLRGNRVFNNRCGDRDAQFNADPFTADGGGIGIESAAPEIRYNWIIDNFACDEGGGISSDGNAGSISHNTIALNDAFNGGSGVRFAGTMASDFVDNNIVQYGPWESSGVYSASGGLPITYSHNNVFSLTARNYENILLDPECMSDNFSLPSLFVDPLSDDYRLASNSPLRSIASDGGDLGWNFSLDAPVILTLDTVQVSSGGSIQAAINMADKGDVVLVDTGLYVENLTLKSGVILKSVCGADSTHLRPASAVLPIMSGDSLHHTTSVSGFLMVREGVNGFTLTGTSRPYIFANVIDSCDTGVVQRDTSVAWVQHNTYFENSMGIYCLDSLAVLSHNIFDGTVGLSVGISSDDNPDLRYPHARRNDFASGNPTGNPHNISGAPQFRDSASMDFHLRCNSPCRPEVTLDSTLIGALEFDRDFDLTGNFIVQGAAGQDVFVPFLLRSAVTSPLINLGLYFSDSLGWTLTPDTSLITTLAAQNDCTFTVVVQIPIGAAVGTVDTVGCRVQFGADTCQRKYVESYVRVLPNSGAAANLVIYRSSNNAVLTWRDFGDDCVYSVLASDNPAFGFAQIAQTTDTSYVDTNVLNLPAKRFYLIEVIGQAAVADPDNDPAQHGK